MIGLQPTHILVILLVALVIFAPMRIPQLIRGAKRMFSEFHKEIDRNDQNKKAPRETLKKLDPEPASRSKNKK